MYYKETLRAVIDWGLDRFEAAFGDAKIKARNKEELSPLEANIITCFGMLHPIVKLREEAQALVYDLNTPKFARACPLPLSEGASDYALHKMEVVYWDPPLKQFHKTTLMSWLDDLCETHSLLLVGKPGAGKSKLLHMLAWELCVGKEGCSEYVYTKSLDPLGVLSHSGVLRRAGCLVITDCSLSVGRNTKLDDEELKSLLDVVEGGGLQSCRYRTATIDAGLPRIIATNMGDSTTDHGAWFDKHGQPGIGHLVKNLHDLPLATRIIGSMGDDAVAAVRRVAVCCLDHEQSLITGALLERLQSDTSVATASRRSRRAAYWAERG